MCQLDRYRVLKILSSRWSTDHLKIDKLLYRWATLECLQNTISAHHRNLAIANSVFAWRVNGISCRA